MSRSIRYAVVGLGHIAQVAVLPAFAQSRHSKLCALVTGDTRVRKALSKKYGVSAHPYEEFELALREQEIEAVFIALPNTLHREYTERAAAAGVHVLCEKPMAVTEKDCQAMIRACGKARVLLMIAYRLHFTGAHLRAIEFVRKGGIGQLRYFDSLFAMQVAGGNIRTDRDLGGGPLPDIGVYCINASRYLFRDEPVQVYATSAARKDRRFKEVMEMASVVLTFPENRLATFTCSFGSSDMDQFDLVGTKGSIHMEPAFAYEGSLKWVVKRGDKPKDKTQEHTFPPGDQFAGELDYFSQCILKGRVPEPSGEEGLADVRILNAIMESIRTKRPVSIKPTPGAGKRRPTISQLIKRRPARKTPLVGVDTPHRD